MRLIYLAFLLFSFCSLSSQNTPVITKATATWCPNCGAWAWDFMEAMKAEFQSGPAIVLGAHFQNSDIESPASVWFAENLNAGSRPLFYLNNEQISAGNNWQTALDGMPASIEAINSALTAGLSYNSIGVDAGTISVSAKVEKIPTTPNKLYIGTYIFENNVEANQAQQGPNSLHPNVIRASMTSDMQGTQITSFGDYEFTMDVDPEWQVSELGIVTIIWEEVGDNFMMLASGSAHNISQLSSDDEILDARTFSFRDAGNNLIITATDDSNYALTLTDMSGQKIISSSFSQEISLDKTTLVAGMYIATLRNEKGLLSQQIFIK